MHINMIDSDTLIFPDYVFNKLLLDILEEFTPEDERRLRFLMYKILPKNVLHQSCHVMEILNKARESGYLWKGNIIFLQVLLRNIDRYDLYDLTVEFCQCYQGIKYITVDNSETIHIHVQTVHCRTGRERRALFQFIREFVYCKTQVVIETTDGHTFREDHDKEEVLEGNSQDLQELKWEEKLRETEQKVNALEEQLAEVENMKEQYLSSNCDSLQEMIYKCEETRKFLRFISKFRRMYRENPKRSWKHIMESADADSNDLRHTMYRNEEVDKFLRCKIGRMH